MYENKFSEYNENSNQLNLLLQEYENIKNQLENLAEDGKISELTKCSIIDMSSKTLEHIAKNHDTLREGVKSVMGGKVLEYEAKTIYKNGKFESYAEMVRDGFIPISEAAKRLGMSLEEFQNRFEKFLTA